MVKIVILGDPNIGKSCLISRFVNGSFSIIDPTIGCNYFRKEIFIDDFKVKLDIWDTAGQEKYRSLTPMYFRNADIILLCFDLSDIKTLKNILTWNNFIKTSLNNPNAYICLVGLKLDIKDSLLVDVIDDFKNKYSYDYYETSAKTGDNIDTTFTTIVRKFVETNPVFESNIKASISLQKPEPTSSSSYCRFF